VIEFPNSHANSITLRVMLIHPRTHSLPLNRTGFPARKEKLPIQEA